MEWKKLKNLIILLLLLANLGLLMLGFGQSIGKENRAARENAISLLKQQGIEINTDIVPAETKHTAFSVEKDEGYNAALAAALLGKTTKKQVSASQSQYIGDGGSIQFYQHGEFIAEFADNLFPLEAQGIAAHSETILKKIDGQWQLSSPAPDDGQKSGTISYTQMFEKTAVTNCILTLTYENGQLKSMAATHRIFTANPQKTEEGFSVATGLSRFLFALRQRGDVCSRIVSITPEYRLLPSLSLSATLAPGWRIVTNTETYWFNLLDGTLSAEFSSERDVTE